MKRLVSLDVLRAVAILLVLGHHPPGNTLEPSAHGYAFFHLWHRVGWVGVDLFFVLSGFLIGGLLFAEIKKNGVINARRFYVRRAFKIWPPYFAFLAAAALLALHDRQATPSEIWSDFWPNLLHIQNYTGVSFARWHTWSLAVEEHFYLLLPLLLLGLIWMRKARTGIPPRVVPVLFSCVAVTCLLMRIATQSTVSGAFIPTIHHSPTHLRLDSLMAGVALSYAVAFRPALVNALYRWRWVLPLLAAACFAPVVIAELNKWPFLWTYGFTLLWIGSACIVLFAWFGEDAAVTRSFPARALAVIGFASYSIYLWHMPLGHRLAFWLCRQVDLPRAWQFPALMGVYVGVAIALGWVLMYAIERPALIIRDRLLQQSERVSTKVGPTVEIALVAKEA